MISRAVIIGAGASIDSSGGSLPGAKNFIECIRSHPTLRYILDDPDIRKVFTSFAPISLDDPRALKRFDKINIEDLFTLASLEQEMDPSDKRLWLLTELIRKTIETCSAQVQPGGNYEHFVKDFLNGETSVITYNWDTLLDRELLDYCPPGAQEGPKNPSLHWEYRRICTAEVLGTYSGLDRPPPTSKVQPKPAYLKLHGSVDSVYCKNQYCRNFMMPFRVTESGGDHFCADCFEKVVPFLVPPVQNKPIRQFPHIRRAWMLASKILSQAEEVVIWGYSLPETDHWSKWLLGHLWGPEASCKKLTIINPEVAGYNRTKQCKTLKRSFVSKFVPWNDLSSGSISVECYEVYDLFKKGEIIR